MQDKNRELSRYRLSLAKETLANARLCIDNHFYRDGINRSYYAAFYAVRSVLALEGVDFKRHKDVMGYFNKTYVAGGLFPKEIGRELGRIQIVREESDYSDFFIASLEEALKQYETAAFVICLVEKYTEEKMS